MTGHRMEHRMGGVGKCMWMRYLIKGGHENKIYVLLRVDGRYCELDAAQAHTRHVGGLFGL